MRGRKEKRPSGAAGDSATEPASNTTVTAWRGGRRGSDRRAGVVALSGLGAVLLLLPLALPNDYYFQVAIMTAMFGAMALGWNLIGGYANQVSLGHAVFFGVGAYVTAILQLDFGLTPWLGMVVAMGASALIAAGVGALTFRLSGHYFALATLAILQVFLILFTYFRGLTGGSVGLFLPILHNDPGMFQFDSPIGYYYVMAAMLLVTASVSFAVAHSRLGIQLFALKGNADAAVLAGVNVFAVKMRAFVLSGVIVAMVGAFYMQFVQFIDPASAFAFSVSINMVLFAVVGGTRSWWGPLLGAALLVPLGQYTSLQLTGRLAPLGEVVYGVLLVLVVTLRPRGLSDWLGVLWSRLSARGSA